MSENKEIDTQIAQKHGISEMKYLIFDEFVDEKPLEKKFIYLLFENDKLVYIGQAENVFSRVHEHRKKYPNITYVKYFEVESCNANDVEAELIIKNLPIYNKSIPSNKRYLTVDDANKIIPKVYQNKVGFLRKLKDLGVVSIMGYYHFDHLHRAASDLNGSDE
jgi:hypothetical protein